MGRKLDSATAGKTQEYYRTRSMRQPGDPLNDPDDQERTYNARATLDTLKQVADWFGGVHGRRKTILFVSEGIDYDITDVFNPGATRARRRSSTRRATRSRRRPRRTSASTASTRAA